MTPTKTPLNIGDRIEVSGEIRQLSGPHATDRMAMTVLFPGSDAPVVIDAVWAQRDPAALQVGVFVQLRGRLTRLNRDTAVVQLEGHPYEVTLPLRDLRKI